MKTGSVLSLGGAVLLLFGTFGGLFFLWPLVRGDGGVFSNLLAVGVLGVIPAAAGLFLIGTGRRRAKIERESEERGFADLASALAKSRGGQVGIDEICKASGLPSDEAQAKMRALTGRGLFDLDFDANGQMVYRLSEDAGRLQLRS